MLPERADQMLRDYKVFLGRCKYLTALIPWLKAEAADWKQNMAEELSSIGSQNMDGMPHGTMIGNPTERFGIMLADGYTPDGLKEMEKQIEEYEKELKEKSTTVFFVEAWLAGLTEKERWIIQSQVIDGLYWREIIMEYHRKYGEEYSREGLKKIRDGAMNKIHQMAS